MRLIKTIVCLIFGHVCEKKLITLENYQNYIVPCTRCKRQIQKIFSRVEPPVDIGNNQIVKWFLHEEKLISLKNVKKA